jgi:Ca-activated chloride channel family protein
MRFVHPEYLWLLLALPLFAALGWWTLRARRRALQRFAGGAAFIPRFTDTVSVHRRAAKLLLLYLALACGITAAARPQWGTRLEQVTRGGADLIAVLDTSLSMAAEDVAPSRLGMARHTIDSLVKKLDGDRVALVTFAGRATLACPLTLDHAAVRLFLDAVDIESVPIAGTSLSDALRAAIRAFGAREAPTGTRSRAIILFTDGEDHEGGIDEVLSELKEAGVAVYAVGVGTTRGSPIPLRDGSGASQGYKTDKAGKVVTTRLDETVLEDLALATGGRYYRATAGQVEVDEITQAMSALDTQDFGAVLRARYEERFQIPLAIGLLALLLETMFGDRRKEASTKEATP